MHVNGQLCSKLNLMPWGCLMPSHSENSDLVSDVGSFSQTFVVFYVLLVGLSCIMYLKPSNRNCLLLHLTSSIHQISLYCLHGFIVLTSSGRLAILTENFLIYLHFNIHCSVVCCSRCVNVSETK